MSLNSGRFPVKEFQAAIRNAEERYIRCSVSQIVSTLRLQYYSGFGFDQLLPDSKGVEVEYPNNPFPTLLDRQYIALFRSRANQNGEEDNESPYLSTNQRGSSEDVDFGHLVLTMDAAKNDRTSAPYTDFRIPNIDISSWVADLAIAAYWNEIFTQSGTAGLEAAKFLLMTGRDPKGLLKKIRTLGSSLNFDHLYEWSAPETDLLGDIDGFALNMIRVQNPGHTLHELFEMYYSASSGPKINQRYFLFCISNDLNYSYDSQDWADLPSIEGKWIPRIDRCIDLFMTGNWDIAANVFNAKPIPPPKGGYRSSRRVLEKFLKWVLSQLKEELRRSNGPGTRKTGRLFP